MTLPRNMGTTERVISGAIGAALVAGGLRRRSAAGAIASLLGGAFLFRSATGHCPVKARLIQGEPGSGQAESAVLPHGEGYAMEESIVVARPARALYDFWRNFENLPRFMDHLYAVTRVDETRSRWVAEGPAGQRVEWEAEIIHDDPGARIGWRSLPGSEVTHAGSVQFLPAPDGNGTEVRVHLRYEPPLGLAGKLIAKVFRKEPETQIAKDLERFKELMEVGESG